MSTATLLAFSLAGTALVGLALAAVVLWKRERQRVAHLEVRLREETNRVQASHQASSAFFNLVSHELRSPIASIIGYQELLRDGAYGSLGDGAVEALDRIGQSAYHLLHLVDGIVDLASEHAGTLAPDLQPVPLAPLIDHVVTAFHAHARERALRHSVHMDSRLPEVRSDPERLQRALELLVISALKHPAGDRVELTIEAADGGANVRIDGVRLPVDRDAEDPVVRTGIRLAIVAGTARHLGCELRLEPEDADVARQVRLLIRDAPAL
jgi:signal transduction histidine kinase